MEIPYHGLRYHAAVGAGRYEGLVRVYDARLREAKEARRAAEADAAAARAAAAEAHARAAAAGEAAAERRGEDGRAAERAQRLAEVLAPLYYTAQYYCAILYYTVLLCFTV
jgi:hypothetical protein